MLIALTYDLRYDYLAEGYTEEQTAEFDSPATIGAIESALQRLGHTTTRVGHIRALTARLANPHQPRPDLVFNIAEGLHGIGREAQVPALLDAFGIPYTFSDPLVCALTLHKGHTKRIVRDAGLHTPDFELVSRPQDVDGVRLAFPLFAKPVAEGTSKGIHADSKIATPGALRAVCERLLREFAQPVLVERFLPGREVTVGVVGTGDAARAVGVLGVELLPEADAEIYTYGNKEHYASRVRYRLADPARDAFAAASAELALAAWRTLGCRDAGRVDIRADADGRPAFLEVNPLPGLHPDRSDLPILCRQAGIAYDDLIGRIVASASERLPRREGPR